MNWNYAINVMAILYEIPDGWIRYDARAIAQELAEAKAAVLALDTIPYQRSWAERMQEIELKREIAGTSRIEGAEFTDRELDQALADETPEEALNRSQKQARAAKRAYLWIAELPDDMPVDQNLIRDVHRHIVTGCDDDHCPPGEFRGPDQNVTFGQPRHRGVDGGAECKNVMGQLSDAIQGEFPGHDPFVQALAVHYLLAAMHPLLYGNGRTARALEAVLLRRSRLKRELFIAMSNFYYDEKHVYLATLAEVRASAYDLTPFLKFGLRGIAFQCHRLLGEIRVQLEKTLFRDVMHQMFSRLRSTRKRVMAKRQLEILSILLDREPAGVIELFSLLHSSYGKLRAPEKAYVRDLTYLLQLGAIRQKFIDSRIYVSARLEWATEITETKFFAEMNKLPKAKTLAALR